MSLSLLEAALAYARLGWRVFPLVAKVPITAHGHLEATADAEQIRAWWTAHPDASIGVHLRASGMVAIDEDPRNGGDTALAALELQHGALPRERVQRTGGGGRHFVMADPSPGQDGWTRTQETGGACRGKLGPGVDVKCNGYIVVEPSPGYTWEALNLAAPPPPVPAAWQALLRKEPPAAAAGPDAAPLASVDSWARSVGSFGPGDAARLRALLDSLGPRGSGGNTTFQAVQLVHHGFGRSVTDGRPYLAEWNARSGKPMTPAELDRQVERVARHEGRGERGGLCRGETPPEPEDEPSSVLAEVVASLPAPEVDPAVACLLSEIALREKPPIRSYSTGDPALDEMIGGGICTRQLLIVAAPPADGKSALAVDWGLELEQVTWPATDDYPEHRLPVLYVSTELESDEIMARHGANVMGCPWREIVRGKAVIDGVQLSGAALRQHVSKALGCEVLARDNPLESIAREAIALREETGVPPLVIVDYMQDLARGTEENVRGKMGDIAMTLRAMAQALDCPVLAVSSVSRTYYGSAKQEAMRESSDPRVYMAAAKESGDIDFAAATILFLDVGVRESGQDYRPARIAVAKARHGDPAFAGAKFYGATGRWLPAPEALQSLSSEETKKRREDEEQRDFDERVRAALREHGQAITKQELIALTRGDRGKVGKAVDRLTTKGEIIPRGAVMRGRVQVPLLALASLVAPEVPPASGPAAEAHPAAAFVRPEASA